MLSVRKTKFCCHVGKANLVVRDLLQLKFGLFWLGWNVSWILNILFLIDWDNYKWQVL